MSKQLICDVCSIGMWNNFSDKVYRVQKKFHIFERTPAYDGYAPFDRRSRVDLCSDCFQRLCLGIGREIPPPKKASRGTLPVKKSGW